MNNFNFNEWKQMQEMPFTYIITKLTSTFKQLAFILGVIFVLLYVCGKIDWSLWLITLPFWYSVPLTVIAGIIDTIKNKHRKTW